jgi:hypothetical protein
MALSKNFTLRAYNQDVVVPNAYLKVTQLSGNKESMQAIISIFTEKNGVVLSKFDTSFTPDLNGDNFVTQAYEHAKTLPEFVDAANC